MPIYRFQCGECESTDDYLVLRIGEKPDSCMRCGYKELSRVFHGQTFSSFKSTKIDVKGNVEPISHVNETKPKLEQGIYVTAGIDERGRETINVSRVQENGKIDASVTGKRKYPLN